MTKPLTAYADPFLGNGEIALPAPVFPADTWHFIKGLSGNTSPAAALPFGKYSAGPYDGAYPAGCGINAMNCGGPIRKLFDRPHFIGLSHLHHDGTGAIGVYYNYALTVPFYGDFPSFRPLPILREEARPGYYLAETEEAISEATVTPYAALHRYRFKDSCPHGIAVDFANDGLGTTEWNQRGKVTGRVEVISADRLRAVMILQKAAVCFDFELRGGALSCLFLGDRRFPDPRPGSSVALDTPEDCTRLGGVFSVGETAEVRLTVSFIGPLPRSPWETEPRSFDEAMAAADAAWESALSRIRIETEDEREKEIFYSNLYHSLTKPCDLTDEAFLFRDPHGPFVTDLATMWDIYKTELPLLFTLYDGISEKILASFARFGQEYGYYPHCVLSSGRLDIENKQARMLAEYAFCDGYYRGVRADYPALIEGAEADARRTPPFFGERPLKTGPAFYASHVLDMAEAFTALSRVASLIGMEETSARYRTYGERWTDAFGPDGMMRPDSDYYEGNRYNYSFRPVFDMKTRTALAGKEHLIREAERFFGFRDRDDLSSRFEGFNNETDMEAPLFLHELGLRDEMIRVIRTGLDGMYTTGRGGIPGNADSGGLTACYLWNALGLFPVTGQDRMIVGCPRFREAELLLRNGNRALIRRVGSHDKNAFPVRAEWNGRELNEFEIPVTDLMRGGTLTVTVSDGKSAL